MRGGTAAWEAAPVGSVQQYASRRDADLDGLRRSQLAPEQQRAQHEAVLEQQQQQQEQRHRQAMASIYRA